MRMSSDSQSENELRAVDAASHAQSQGSQSYYMPTDSVSPEEWTEFDNVYQVYCPQIIMDNAIRGVMMQYYYLRWSFIRDQTEAALAEFQRDCEKQRGPAVNAQPAAVVAVRKRLGSDRSSTSFEISPKLLSDSPASIDPLQAWSDGVSLRKSHFCLLLKPQVVLQIVFAQIMVRSGGGDDHTSGGGEARTRPRYDGLQAPSRTIQ
ncbi:hypothetical protein A0H81_09422 [Grifola frondosa]|uniref:Uncharacterized protein n=1 Tax=Grifola frondosa TaxID=5627 RepID=A0A1C7M0T5_GRIFR|nr:hypothetical protein A0H81_09422 [Grifola frondosa]